MTTDPGDRTMKKTQDEPETLTFATQKAWREWLQENQTLEAGVWLRMYKKGSGIESINYAEALDEALCVGWIDGQKRSFDETSWVQRFVPRRPRSTWSKVNRQHVQRLIDEGRMQEAGLREVEKAKTDGRWEAAYDSASTSVPPDDFLQALAQNAAAREFFERLDRQNVYAILYRIQTAKKPETRERRIATLVEMLAKGEKLHP